MLNDKPFFVSIPAEDKDRAKTFFADKLGMQPVYELDFAIRYQTGEMRFQVVQSASAGKAEYSLLTWEVEDIQATVTQLRENGVEFVEYDFPYLKTDNYIANVSGALLAWFKDSEGNLHALVQP